MKLTVSYEDNSEYGQDTLKSVSRYEAPDFDKAVIELRDSNNYIEYDNARVVNAEGTGLTLVVQHDKGDSTRHEDVTEIQKTSENICIKKSTETNPVYLPTTNKILWIAGN